MYRIYLSYLSNIDFKKTIDLIKDAKYIAYWNNNSVVITTKDLDILALLVKELSPLTVKVTYK